jgi:hypothetical protein
MLGANNATKTIKQGIARGVIDPIDLKVNTPPKLESKDKQKIAAKKRTNDLIR